MEGYSNLHRQGISHSIEVWSEDRLVGGLYGLSVGKMFFGESMFALENNASKAGFITLVRALEKSSFWLVDCQVGTPHLESLGARGISRDKYLELLGQNTYNRTLMGSEAETAERSRLRSPIHRAEELSRTPVLLLHGDADPVVSVTQSRELVSALRGAGGVVEYVEFAGEGHGFRGLDSKRDEYHAMERFLSGHLRNRPVASSS